eukprot:gene956-1856_t
MFAADTIPQAEHIQNICFLLENPFVFLRDKNIMHELKIVCYIRDKNNLAELEEVSYILLHISKGTSLLIKVVIHDIICPLKSDTFLKKIEESIHQNLDTVTISLHEDIGTFDEYDLYIRGDSLSQIKDFLTIRGLLHFTQIEAVNPTKFYNLHDRSSPSCISTSTQIFKIFPLQEHAFEFYDNLKNKRFTKNNRSKNSSNSYINININYNTSGNTGTYTSTGTEKTEAEMVLPCPDISTSLLLPISISLNMNDSIVMGDIASPDSTSERNKSCNTGYKPIDAAVTGADAVGQCTSANTSSSSGGHAFFWVRNKEGRWTSLIDRGVYTRNRAFRLFLSCKYSKTAVMKLATATATTPTGSLTGLNSMVKGKSFQLPYKQLIRNVLEHSLIIPLYVVSESSSDDKFYHNNDHIQDMSSAQVYYLDMPKALCCKSSVGMNCNTRRDQQINSMSGSSSLSSSVEIMASSRHLTSSTFVHSPFPHIDSLALSYANSRGSGGVVVVEGFLKSWSITATAFNPNDGQNFNHSSNINLNSIIPFVKITYQIGNNKFCSNIGRQHKSNSIMIEADLTRGLLSQRCWDPECRSYRSLPIIIPEQCRPDDDLLRRIWIQRLFSDYNVKFGFIKTPTPCNNPQILHYLHPVTINLTPHTLNEPLDKHFGLALIWLHSILLHINFKSTKKQLFTIILTGSLHLLPPYSKYSRGSKFLQNFAELIVLLGGFVSFPTIGIIYKALGLPEKTLSNIAVYASHLPAQSPLQIYKALGLPEKTLSNSRYDTFCDNDNDYNANIVVICDHASTRYI